jgi:allophanate hydrolase subunit 2
MDAAGRTLHSRQPPQVAVLGAAGDTTLRFVRYSGLASARPGTVETFMASTWIVSEQTDRMGTRLRMVLDSHHGGDPLLKTDSGDLLSFGVVRGTIQLPPSGEPVILNADHQTTGGYPVIGVVVQADWPLVAQLRPGDRIKLVETTIAEARRALSRASKRL